jgi:flagellar hook-associated protein 3 FlgL
MTPLAPTNTFYARSNGTMNELTRQAQRLMDQNSSGKKLLAPSDDAVAYRRLETMKLAGADELAYGDNIKVAQATLTQADTQLGEIGNLLQEATNRVLQGANDTLSANDRKTIAADLRSILETIVSNVNVKDARGQPLFGGQDGTAPVTSQPDGTFVFALGKQGAIPIGDGQTVEPSASAGEVLAVGGTGGRDLGAILTALITSFESGTGPVEADQTDLAAISEQVIQAQSSVGARGARVELQAGYYTQAALEREDARSAIEDNDFTETTIQLQKTLTILQATQASFAQLSKLTLFDYIR